jgi:hypothetical protein
MPLVVEFSRQERECECIGKVDVAELVPLIRGSGKSQRQTLVRVIFVRGLTRSSDLFRSTLVFRWYKGCAVTGCPVAGGNCS